MKALNLVLGAVVAATGFVASAPAEAHGHAHGRGHWAGPRVGFYVGGPLWWGAPLPYWGPPYVAAPYVVPPVAVPAAPPPVVYIERGDQVQSTAPQPAPTPQASHPPAAPGTSWWYLCASPRGAYPYVRECPGGWERVPAVPPSESR